MTIKWEGGKSILVSVQVLCLSSSLWVPRRVLCRQKDSVVKIPAPLRQRDFLNHGQRQNVHWVLPFCFSISLIGREMLLE